MAAVGVIGVGVMGGPIARRIAERGHQVTAFDVNAEALRALAKSGVKGVASPEEVAAASEVTLVVVVDDAQVHEVCLGPHGVLAGARAGAILCILSSVSPATCRTMAERGRAKGVHVLDAPMVRGAAAAEEGRLLLMVGGDADALARARPVFEAVATDVCHLGEVGDGQVGKAVNNLLLWIAVVGIREAFTLARTAGVKPDVLRPALYLSSGDSWVLRQWDRICQQPKWWDQKDLGSVLSLAEAHGVAAPLAALTKELMKGLTPERARPLLSAPGPGPR